MAINDNAPEFTPTGHLDPNEAENKKGQMLVIYLPEGSVIVDRTDMDLTKAPQHIAERIVATPEAAQTPVEPQISSQQPVQHTLQELVQLTVQEVMGTNTNFKQNPQNPSGTEFMPHRPRRAHRARVRHRRHLNWVHGINIMFITYIVLVSILPSIVSSFFGISVYASKASHSAVSIAAGDLMICREIPAVGLKANDVVLIRGANTWRLDVRQVTANSFDAKNATLTTAATSGAQIQTTMQMPITSPVYRVSTIVPKLGYVPMVLSSTISKVLGALVILILNLSVHFRRTRRRRFNSDIR